jgi:hypothetical protein
MRGWTARKDGAALVGDEPIGLLDQAFAALFAAYREDHGRPPRAPEWCALLQAGWVGPAPAWHDTAAPEAAFSVAVAPARQDGSGRTMSGSMPKPGAYFRSPLGRGLPAHGQVQAVRDDHGVVRTLQYHRPRADRGRTAGRQGPHPAKGRRSRRAAFATGTGRSSPPPPGRCPRSRRLRASRCRPFRAS